MVEIENLGANNIMMISLGSEFPLGSADALAREKTFLRPNPSTSFKRFAALAATLGLLLAADAWARAGGGGGFSGGGGGGGSGSGGGGGGALIAELIFYYIRLHFTYPIPCILFDVALFFLWRYMRRNADTVWKDTDRTDEISRQIEEKPRLSRLKIAYDALKAADPSFDENAFKQRVANSFVNVQDRWTDGNLGGIRHLTTDGVQERFQILLDMNKMRSFVNITKSVKVKDVRYIEILRDDFFDTIQVEICASAIDYYTDLAGGKIVGGSLESEPFTEYWSFLRRRGAKTVAKGLAAGNCPACGAGIALTDRGECAHCKAIVNSGSYDWVLAEITQTTAGSVVSTAVGGLDALKGRDPAFNVQYVEDRASLIFWRLRMAEMRGSAKPMESIATTGFLSSRRTKLAPTDATGSRPFVTDAAVGALELTYVEPGSGAEPDRLFLRVKWSGRQVKAQLPSLLPPAYDKCELIDQEFILERRADAVTSTNRGMSSNHCSACGAPQSTETGATCKSCGVVLNDGSQDWLLADVRLFSGRRPAGAVQTGDREISHEHVLAAAAVVMKADGKANRAEYALLQQFARERGVSPPRLEAIVRSARQGQMPEIRFNSDTGKAAFLNTMVKLCMADGNISAEEEQLMMGLADKLSPKDYDMPTKLAAAKASLVG